MRDNDRLTDDPTRYTSIPPRAYDALGWALSGEGERRIFIQKHCNPNLGFTDAGQAVLCLCDLLWHAEKASMAARRLIPKGQIVKAADVSPERLEYQNIEKQIQDIVRLERLP